MKKLLGLLWLKGTYRQWQLELGVYLLKKGCGYQIGQIVRERKLGHNKWRVKVITNLFYDFRTNQVNHLKEDRIIHTKD
jgi:hypothetical protein